MKTPHRDEQHCSPNEIAARFNPAAPAYGAYISAFHKHSHELVQIFSTHPHILLTWDGLVNGFSTNELMTGSVNAGSNHRMKALLNEVHTHAGVPLRSAIERHQYEIDHFPDTMAFMLFSFYFF